MLSFVRFVQTESEMEVKDLIDALGLKEKQQYVRISCSESLRLRPCFLDNIKPFSLTADLFLKF